MNKFSKVKPTLPKTSQGSHTFPHGEPVMLRKSWARAIRLEEPEGLLVKEPQSEERAKKTNLFCGHSDLGDQEWEQEDKLTALGY